MGRHTQLQRTLLSYGYRHLRRPLFTTVVHRASRRSALTLFPRYVVGVR